MALIIMNPADSCFEQAPVAITNTLHTIWRATILMASTCSNFAHAYIISPLMASVAISWYQIFIYIPIWIQYRLLAGQLSITWWILTLCWWITLITAYWDEPLLKPGKKFNGTYWMHVKEDL